MKRVRQKETLNSSWVKKKKENSKKSSSELLSLTPPIHTEETRGGSLPFLLTQGTPSSS